MEKPWKGIIHLAIIFLVFLGIVVIGPNLIKMAIATSFRIGLSLGDKILIIEYEKEFNQPKIFIFEKNQISVNKTFKNFKKLKGVKK